MIAYVSRNTCRAPMQQVLQIILGLSGSMLHHHVGNMFWAARPNGATLLWVFLVTVIASAQDLVPRAYLITPKDSNAITLSYGWNDGEVNFDPSAPIENPKGRFHSSVFSYYHSYGLLGRSSNVVVSVPYASGLFEGSLNGVTAQATPTGLADARIRFSMNLLGGPAMNLSEFREWSEERLIGVSITAIVPIGQNDPARLVNIGTNRWAFKPEVGLTRRWRRWVAEGYGGLWLFTPNRNFYPGDAKRTQGPMTAIEGHLGYYVKAGLWASLDGNFWAGGTTSINGVQKQDAKRESRLGVSVSIPIVRHQSLKFSFSRGAITRIGGNFQSLSAAWQYSWIGKPY
jgi:hypothetical protein